MPTPQEILTFWFGELGPDGHVTDEDDRAWLWWRKNSEVDAEILEKYEGFVQEAAAGDHDRWAETAAGRLALIIALDQFPRNMYRDDPQAFAYDTRARQLALDGIALGQDRQLSPVQRVFFYLPLEHAEDEGLQIQSVEHFESLAKEVPEHLRETYDGYVDFAERHKVIIDRFGRYPHRNDVLGRASTAEEEAFLQEPGSSF